MSSAAAEAALLTAGAGAAVLAGGVLRGAARGSGVGPGAECLALTFPIGTGVSDALAALRALSGMSGNEFVLEVRATVDATNHVVRVPSGQSAAVRAQVEAAIPGLRAAPEGATRTPRGQQHSRVVVVPRRVVLRATELEEAGRSVLAATGVLAPGESVSVRWAIRPGRPTSGASVFEVLWHGYRNVPPPPAPFVRKAGDAGFAVAGVIVASAATTVRAAAIADGVVASLRSRRTPLGSLVFRAGRRGAAGLPATRSSSGWLSVGELLGLVGWPLGRDAVEGVTLGAARQMRAGRDVPHIGRPLFTAQSAQGPRTVALGDDAARRHCLVVGATGSGKSTILVLGILSDIAAGRGGAVIDPKGDLIADLLARIAPEFVDRIAVIDPAADTGFAGYDLLSGGDPDLRADVLLAALRKIFGDSWGVRSEAYFAMGLRLLAEDPGASLIDWPRIFSDPAYRHRLIGRLKDPVQVAAWQAYEALSPAEQAQHLAPGLNKLTALLSRPRLRAIVAQPSPKLDIARHMESGGWVFVSAAPGPVGDSVAHFIAAITTYAVWAAVEARSGMPRDQRKTLGLVFDELTSLSALPFGVETLFERARSLGGAVTVAVQSLARVPEQTRSAALGNAGTLITFRSGADEAARIARELPGLAPSDVLGLGRYEVAARVSLGPGGATRVVTGVTEPMPPDNGGADAVRAASAARFGRSLEEIESMIRERYGMPEEDADTPVKSAGSVGRRRRQP